VGVNQHYLYQARQMQALSLTVHIPLVCFGIAFPVLVLFAEYRYLRTGDPLYRTLAKRWSRIMLALFAVGVVTGTILSFELGLLWPVWMQDFGNVFGLGFTLEGFSFFVEAIFIGIYAYGWDRLKPWAHFASGIPIALAGVAGSLFVIAVNGWMNHPTGFTLRDGRAVDVHPWQALFDNPLFWSEYIHMYFAAYIVCGFLLGGAYAWAFLRGRRGRYERAALGITMSAASVAAPLQVIVGDWAARDVAATSRSSWPRSKGSRTPPGARPSTCSASTTGRASSGASRSRACCRSWPPTTPTRSSRAWTSSRWPTSRRSTWCGSPSRPWSESARCLPCWLSSTCSCAGGGARCPAWCWPPSWPPGRCRWSR
jgi:hypothetical protein